MPFIHSPADGPDHVEVAALLVAMADEAGIHTREIIVTPHGFEIPDALFEQLNPANAVVLSDPRDEGKTPPPGWDEPLADEVNVEQAEDGKFYLKDDAPVGYVDVTKQPTPVLPENSATENSENLATILDSVEEAPVVKHSEIREWAVEQGIKVSAKGKLPQDIVDAFYAAHSGE